MDTEHLQSSGFFLDYPRLTLTQLNELNQQFWIRQRELLERRMSDETIRKVAFAKLRSDAMGGLPLKNQPSLESALAEAEQEQSWFRQEFSRKGGQAPKADALNRLIQRLVLEGPNLNERQLLHKLRRLESEGDVKFFTDTDDVETIQFWDEDGKEKTAPVTGLKDRLARTKRKIMQKTSR